MGTEKYGGDYAFGTDKIGLVVLIVTTCILNCFTMPMPLQDYYIKSGETMPAILFLMIDRHVFFPFEI